MKTINKFLFAVLLLSTFCLSAAAQTTRDDDFEIVVPGQKDAKTNQVPTASVVTQPPVQTPAPVRNNTVNNGAALPNISTGKKGRAGKRPGDITAASLGAVGALPLRVEVSDLQADATITLGVGAATRFQTQEKPTRLVIGNLTDIGVTKAGSSSWYGFYLRPVNGGITTNMFIEFASGATRMINLKTVDPKVLRPGDYNSEVFVKTAAARDELLRTRTENETLRTKLINLETALKQKKPEEIAVPVKKITYEEMDAGMWNVLEKSSGLIKNNSGFLKDAVIGKVQINVLTPLWETQKNQGYLWMEISNKEKKAVSITKIEIIGARGEVVASKSGLIVEPNKQLQFGIRISVDESSPVISQLRFTTSEGKTGDIALSGFAIGAK